MARKRAGRADASRLVLVLNAGSSSLKAALFEVAPSAGASGIGATRSSRAKPSPTRALKSAARGPASADGMSETAASLRVVRRLEVSGLRSDAPRLRIRDGDGTALADAPAAGIAPGSYADALALMLTRLAEAGFGLERIAAAGHRVVHGGTVFRTPVIVDDGVVSALDGLAHLAPHHVPPNIAGIRSLMERLPGVPQVACFDTAFHADQLPEAADLPLPSEYRDRGFRRYGFHGLSYAYVVSEFERATGVPLPERTIIAHLGNGASMCAVQSGRGVATTMGYSTLDGLVMGTRCGAIDPGVLIELVRSEGLDAAGLEDLLYNRSGLLGLSGLTGDMRELLESDRPEARRAVEHYAAAAARHAAALMVALGGCDAIVMTGGIGENARPVRRMILERLAWAGCAIDAAANEHGAAAISRPGSRISAWVIPTDEESMIARETVRLTAPMTAT